MKARNEHSIVQELRVVLFVFNDTDGDTFAITLSITFDHTVVLPICITTEKPEQCSGFFFSYKNIRRQPKVPFVI